ncbi:arginine--tRNA ligase, partial [Candidatus Daviesbacteria bacterium]|nr:arginine--tRNA ligase [Candidatus Daviesbacteria bacterium]
MVKQKILEDLQKAVEDLGYKSTDIVLSIPKNSAFGDYSTNIALQLAKQSSANGKQTPDEIANEIVARVKSQESSKKILEKVEVVNGFVNFFVKPEILAEDLQEILQKEDDYGKSKLGKGKKARVEFVSANPTGPLHFGNARGGPIGDVLANVLEFSGYEVLREYYDNNIGGQVTKLGESIANVKAGNKLADQEYKGEYVAEIVDKIGDFKDAQEAGEKAVGLLFQEIIKDCADLGIKFDQVYHESDFVKRGATKKALDELENKGFLKKYEGAFWFAPKDEFLQDRECVVVKSDGEYTYFANDIAYHKVKFSGGHDLIVNILGANHHGHVPRLQA